jgi:predicted permease
MSTDCPENTPKVASEGIVARGQKTPPATPQKSTVPERQKRAPTPRFYQFDRTNAVTIKVTDDEYATLARLAKGQTVTAWVHEVVLTTATPRPIDYVLLTEFLALRTILLNLHAALADVRYAARGLRRSPIFTTVAVLTIAIGIGANTAIFSVVNAVLLRPLPYANGDRLRELSIEESPGNRTSFLDAAHVDAIRAQTGTFAAVERYGMGAETLTDGDPEMVASPGLSPGFLQVLGAAPMLGRLFTAEEADRGDRVVLISERLWRTRFGGAADIVGRRIGIEGEPHTIVGVLPARFAFPERTAAVWHPLPANPHGESRLRRGTLVAVLRPGVTEEAAAESLRAAAASLRQHGMLDGGSTLIAGDMMQRRFGARAQTELWVLLGAVLLVFVIACVNVAHLLLARVSAREAEFAVMSALGANRVRVLGALLAESVAVALLGGLAGAVVARALLATMLASIPSDMRLLSSAVIGLDWRAFTFATALAGTTCLLVSLLPAFRIGRLDVVEALRGGARSVAGDAHERWHRWMVVTQLALVLMLLVTSGLLLRSFARLVSVPPGFDVAGRVVAEVQFPAERYRTPGAATRVMSELDRRMEAVPGVRAVTFSQGVPPRSGILHMNIRPEADGLPPPPIAGLEMPELTVAPDYFATLGVPLVAGRTFMPADGEDADHVQLFFDVPTFCWRIVRACPILPRSWIRASPSCIRPRIAIRGSSFISPCAAAFPLGSAFFSAGFCSFG